MTFFSSFAYAAEAQWLPKVLEPGKHIIQVSKDYYVGKYAFDTKTDCDPQTEKCFGVGTTVKCSSYSYVDATPTSRYQFCNIEYTQNTTQKADEINRPRKKTSMVTGFVEMKDGKPVRFIGGVPKNTIFEADLNGKPIVQQAEIKPKPKIQPKPQVKSETEGNVCKGKDCELEIPGVVATLRTNVNSAASYGSASYKKQVAEAFKKAKFGEGCLNFVDKNGNLGNWGKQAVKIFKDVCKECFYGSNAFDMGSICPKYKNFSPAQRDLFVGGWLTSAIATPESTCRQNVRVKGTKVKTKRGVHQEYAVGIFQLEESMYRRKGRGPECQTRNGETLYSMSFQLRCTASILKETRFENGHTLWGSSNQYWYKLRDKSGYRGKISQSLSQFPGCK